MKDIIYKIKAAVVGWFGDIKIYKYPFFILVGHVAYKIKGQHQRKIINLLEPGDVLLRRYDAYISGLMIPGYFTHAGIYVGDDQVIHVLGKGICKEDILTFTRCDDIAILRHNDKTLTSKAIGKAWEQLDKGVAYDFAFDSKSPDKFYCTELVDFCYSYPVRDKSKGKYIIPDDFLNSVFYAVFEGRKIEEM
jgi:hypothetical protein